MDTILYASKSRFIIHIIYIAHIVSIVCFVLSDCISILLHILFAGIFVWCVLPDIYIYFYIFVSIYTEVYRISEKMYICFENICIVYNLFKVCNILHLMWWSCHLMWWLRYLIWYLCYIIWRDIMRYYGNKFLSIMSCNGMEYYELKMPLVARPHYVIRNNFIRL